MLTRPIPPEALAVVEILRRDVPRPKTLPLPAYRGQQLRWENGCCAMGLAPNAVAHCPTSKYGFGYADELQDGVATKFYIWFDEQTDAQATVDAIWPTE